MILWSCTGCQHSIQQSEATGGSFAIGITEDQVPEPAHVPFIENSERQEYLRFYRQAYLGLMQQAWAGSSSISPISEHPHAATMGHNDGQLAAHRAKTDYWAKRGRGYPF